MNTIKMIVELSAEDRVRLDNILAALQNCGTPFNAPAAAPQADQDTPEPVEPATTQPEQPEPVVATEAPKIDRADVQKKVVTLSAAGKKAEVRDIVLAYNNTKVSDIPEDKLPEVMAKLTALEG